MAVYPTPNATDMSDLHRIAIFTNNASGGILFPLILLGIWVITFVGSVIQGRQAVKAFVWANFVCAILGIMLAMMGLLGSNWMYLIILLVGGGVFWIRLQNSSGS